MSRECRIIISCGKRGVGKSVETIRMIDEYVAGNAAKGVPPRKALIFDVNDEFSSFWFFGLVIFELRKRTVLFNLRTVLFVKLSDYSVIKSV